MFFLINNLMWVLSSFWRKWVMKLCILCPPNTKFSYPHQGASPLDPCEHLTHRLSFQQFKMEWRPCISVRKGGGGVGGLAAVPSPIFDGRRGKWAARWEFTISGSMESLVEMVQIENSLRNYVNFTLGNGFSWAFKTLKPMSFRGLRPLDPSAMMESPMKIVQIDNSVRNYMWILPPILPSKTGFLGLLKC